MNRFVCIHGHFYQPPRDDPRTGEIPEQPSAAPFHDWNQRITEECYRPNGASRVLVGGRLVRTMNNYERISHNFGPTLAAWLAAEAPDVYALVRDADDAGRRASAATDRPSPRCTTIPSCPCATTATDAPRSCGGCATSCTATAETPRACGSPRPG